MWDAKGNTLAAYTHTAAGNIATHTVGHVVGDGVGDDIVTGRYAYNAREWVNGIDYAGTFVSTLTYDHAGNVTRQNYRRSMTEACETASYT